MHEKYMMKCLELAQLGRGKPGNNTLVGSVLVHEGVVVAEGFYNGSGTSHAERVVLEKYDQKISTDDTLYINLEPCCHQGETPPCTDIILAKGVQRVVFGMVDPDSRVAGKGIATLRKAGVEVIGPVLPELCRRLNRGFVSLRTKQRSWITLKRAQMRDGRVASDEGRLMITTQEQNTWSHKHLRATHDAILVGVGTVIADNPQLTVRLENKKIDQTFPQPYRIILDPSLRIPLNATVLNDGHAERTIVVVQEGIDTASVEEKGSKVLHVAHDGSGFNFDDLFEKLSTFHFPLSTILVEGGPQTWETFKSAGLVDEEVVLVGPS